MVFNWQWWNQSIYLYHTSILYILFKCKTNKDLSYKQLFVKSQRNHLDCRWQGEMKHWVVCEHHGRNLRLSPFRCSQCRFSPLYQTQSHLPLLHHRFYHHLARYQLEWTEIKLTVMTDWGTKVYMNENLMPSMFILYPEVNIGCVQWTCIFSGTHLPMIPWNEYKKYKKFININ